MRLRKNNLMLLFASAFMSLFILTSCGTNEPEKSGPASEWKIPFLIFLSGPIAGDAAQHKWLTNQVVDEINSAGGIAGKPLRVEFYDTAMDPPKAASCMAQIIDAKALCLLGPMNGDECKAAMPLAFREGIYAFSGTATDDILKQFKPWILNTSGTVEEEKAYAMPMWIKHVPAVTSIAGIIEPTYTFITTTWEAHKAKADEMGIKTYNTIEAPSGMLDYSSIAVRAINTGATGFYVACSEETAAKVVKELINRNVNPNHIWLWANSMGPVFLKQSEGFNEGLYTGTSPTYSENPKYDEYLKRYMETHNGEPLKFMCHYNAELLYLIKEAIETQGITGDPAKLKEERIKIRDYANNKKGFKGLKYTYDIVDGQGVCIPKYLYRIEKGQTVLIDKVVPESKY
ncbi:MAG: amino acid ABC transporter substrate-binding protein [Desulfatiglans sp.]|nr:amino acid ABC transporter substrate-binding protein [Desulfatiglans sp.]